MFRVEFDFHGVQLADIISLYTEMHCNSNVGSFGNNYWTQIFMLYEYFNLIHTK